MRDEVRTTSVEQNMTISSVNKLLRVLSPYHPELPLDARTLLQTSKNKTVIRDMGNGHYCHLRLKNGLYFCTKSVSALGNRANRTIVQYRRSADNQMQRTYYYRKFAIALLKCVVLKTSIKPLPEKKSCFPRLYRTLTNLGKIVCYYWRGQVPWERS